MSFTPNRVELPITYQGTAYTLVFDMMMVARFEEATDKSFLGEMQGLVASKGAEDEDEAKRPPPKLSLMGQLLRAALGEHHPETTLAQAMQMVIDPDVAAMFNEGLGEAMPRAGDVAAEEAGTAAKGNAPKARPRAGKTSSSPQSKAG